MCFNRFDNNLCKQDISRTIQCKFEGSYPSWKKIDPVVREMWFGDFKVMCCFSISMINGLL